MVLDMDCGGPWMEAAAVFGEVAFLKDKRADRPGAVFVAMPS